MKRGCDAGGLHRSMNECMRWQMFVGLAGTNVGERIFRGIMNLGNSMQTVTVAVTSDVSNTRFAGTQGN